jgi:peptidylamidoglycolate lyase
MTKRMVIIVTITVAVFIISVFDMKLLPVQGRAKPGAGFAAIPGEKGGQDAFGPYDVVSDWPKPLSQLMGHENWTYGTVNDVFAESPNRVFIVHRGEIPVLKRPMSTPVPQFGPGLSFPIDHLLFRNTGNGPVAAAPGPPGERDSNWKGKYGVDARWEHILLVFDANGKIVEAWTQWDRLFKLAHGISISPYDPEKNVWVVDDGRDAIFEFSNDGKKLLRTIGTPNERGNDDKHFDGPTYMAWLSDGSFVVGDGYGNSRVVKFDKNGKYLMAWGQKGNPTNETRPGYFNSPHGIAADPVARRVYVAELYNPRIQVFDENGKFLDQWFMGPASMVLPMYMSANQHLWVGDTLTTKFLEYDSEGHLLYSWGTFGDFPGAIWGPHGISVDQEGNLYIASVWDGRVQKFRPRKGANPDFLVGQPVRAAWK